MRLNRPDTDPEIERNLFPRHPAADARQHFPLTLAQRAHMFRGRSLYALAFTKLSPLRLASADSIAWYRTRDVIDGPSPNDRREHASLCDHLRNY
jgi:hypothetical protein